MENLSLSELNHLVDSLDFSPVTPLSHLSLHFHQGLYVHPITHLVGYTTYEPFLFYPLKGTLPFLLSEIEGLAYLPQDAASREVSI